MNIELEHPVIYEGPRHAYWARIQLSNDEGRKSKLLVFASRNYIADTYAGAETVSNKHVDMWIEDVKNDINGLPEDALFIEPVFRRVYAHTPEGQKAGMDFLNETLA